VIAGGGIGAGRDRAASNARASSRARASPRQEVLKFVRQLADAVKKEPLVSR
jgi:hypothetical protein